MKEAGLYIKIITPKQKEFDAKQVKKRAERKGREIDAFWTVGPDDGDFGNFQVHFFSEDKELNVKTDGGMVTFGICPGAVR